MDVDKVLLLYALEEQQGLTTTLLYEVYKNRMKRSGPRVFSHKLVHAKTEKE